MSDCLIVGAGVVGLSLAYELAGHGLKVRIIDAAQPGREASWAGAGILPPASGDALDPLERLTAISNRLHEQWAADLRESTGVDNGYRACGAVYVARDDAEARQLAGFAAAMAQRGIAAQWLSRADLVELEPALQPSGELAAAYLVPAEYQIRNPRHLQALVLGCTQRGVKITSDATADDFDVHGGRLRAVKTNQGSLSADMVCVTTGAWTAALAKKLGASLPITPVRGQMVLLSLPKPAVSRIVNEGRRYLVPRDDGRLLVGSTEEDAGFDRGNTADGVTGLLKFAASLVPELAGAPTERTWAGLRPASSDGRPFLGTVPGLENAFVAAGHFRSGLQLSTGTALVMSQLMRGLTPEVDLETFRLDRHRTAAGPTIARSRPHVPLA